MSKILVECSKCGMHNPQQYVQCISCGNPIASDAKRIVVEDSESKGPEKKKSFLGRRLMHLFVLAFVVFGFYICFLKQVDYNRTLKNKMISPFIKAEYIETGLLSAGQSVDNNYIYLKVYAVSIAFIIVTILIVSLLAYYRKLHSSQSYFKTLAITDELTGLHTHRFLMLALKKEFKKAKRSGKPLAFAITDIDKFKNFNDTYGHEVGNVVLKMFAQVMKDTFRESSLMRGGDILARYGGEEFCVVFPFTSSKGAYAACDRFRSVLERTAIPNLSDVNVTVSIGISAIPEMDNIASVEEMIERADKALYYSKENGRNQVTIYKKSMED